MSANRPRCLVVALCLTAAGSGIAVGLALALTGGRTSERTGEVTVEDAMVGLCLVLLLGCTLWAWAAGLAAVAEAWRGAPSRPPDRGGVVRRLVLGACGVAVTASLVTPAAHATDPDPLTGLPLPERATDGPRPAPAERVVVRTGDTLWALAADRLPPGAPADDVDAAWRRLYAANRDAVGPDPDLIRPGQVLDLSAPPTPTPTEEPR